MQARLVPPISESIPNLAASTGSDLTRMYGQLYVESMRRAVDLVLPLSADELAVTTPACPQWSVHDVLAHLAGAAAAFTAATADGDARPGSEEWTRAQVEARRDRRAAELIAEWQQHAPRVAELPVESRRWLPVLHDTLSHEADIRGAIGAPSLPADALAAAWPLLAEPIARRLAPLGPVALELDEQPALLGSGRPELVVETSQFDFWRGWFGRRSPAQLRGWVRLGDAEAFAATLPVFPARDTDLVEAG